MSWEASAWALNVKLGPKSAARKLVLIAYASHAHKDGTAAFPSVSTVAEYVEVDERTVQRHNAALLDDGLIREGDQRLVAHFDPRHRPVVYDLAMSEETRARWRAERAAGDRGTRDRFAEAGRAGGEKAAALRRGDNLSPLDETPRGDICARPGVTSEPSRGDTGVTQTVPRTTHYEPPTTTDSTSPSSVPVGGLSLQEIQDAIQEDLDLGALFAPEARPTLAVVPDATLVEPLGPVAPLAEPKTAQTRKRGTRVDTWTGPDAALVEWARRECPLVDGRVETEAFFDYWRGVPGVRGTKLDWPGTWRNRMRDRQQFLARLGNRSPANVPNATVQRSEAARTVDSDRRW